RRLPGPGGGGFCGVDGDGGGCSQHPRRRPPSQLPGRGLQPRGPGGISTGTSRNTSTVVSGRVVSGESQELYTTHHSTTHHGSVVARIGADKLYGKAMSSQGGMTSGIKKYPCWFPIPDCAGNCRCGR